MKNQSSKGIQSNDVVYKGKVYTPDMIRQLRDWINDCQWEDSDNIDELSDLDIVKGCDKHLDGGIESFDFGTVAIPVNDTSVIINNNTEYPSIKDAVNDLPAMHLVKVKILPATNTQPNRIAIHSPRFKHTVIISRTYEYMYMVKEAIAYLIERGYSVTGQHNGGDFTYLSLGCNDNKSFRSFKESAYRFTSFTGGYMGKGIAQPVITITNIDIEAESPELALKELKKRYYISDTSIGYTILHHALTDKHCTEAGGILSV